MQGGHLTIGAKVGTRARAAAWLVVLLAACADGPSVSSIRQAATSASSVVAFARTQVSVGSRATINGSLGARDKGGSIALGSRANVTGDVFGDAVSIGASARVVGQVKGNTLDISQQASLSQPPLTPLALPLPDLSPPLPIFQPGRQAITVPGHTTQTLAAGAYGATVLGAGSQSSPTVLRLSGGIYQLQSLQLGSYARLECVAACEVRIQAGVQAGSKSYLGPARKGRSRPRT